MRGVLSNLLAEAAINDERILVLTGDHGYGLFTEIREQRPKQFINCGVAEQGMVGVAAGLARRGFKPIVYGLASFIPIRVLEQIKLDVCYSERPVLFLGDGAGVVYSTLGASHHCAEDIAALRPMPNLSIYSPCDGNELVDCFKEALFTEAPAYIRIGKEKEPVSRTIGHTEYRYIIGKTDIKKSCFVATGSMVESAMKIISPDTSDLISVPRIKPLGRRLISQLSYYKQVVVLEEHSKRGGLFSSIAEEFASCLEKPILISVSMKEQFADKCGSYQYALSEHELDDESLRKRFQVPMNGQEKEPTAQW